MHSRSHRKPFVPVRDQVTGTALEDVAVVPENFLGLAHWAAVNENPERIRHDQRPTGQGRHRMVQRAALRVAARRDRGQFGLTITTSRRPRTYAFGRIGHGKYGYHSAN